MSDCLFCKIIAGEIPGSKVYENDKVFAFRDINPQAPVHVLIVPKKHMANVLECDGETAAARVVATADWYDPPYANGGSQKGADARESYALAPSAIWAPSEDFALGLKTLFQFTEQPSYIGVPVWRGEPGAGYGWRESSCRPGDRSSYKSFLASPWAEWQATDEWNLRLGFTAMVSEWDRTTREPYSALPGTPELPPSCRTCL